MAWIEVHQALLTHRKTLRLARLLHLDTFAVVGRLMALWCWALDNAPDGTVSAQDSDLLADVMGWDGTPDELCGALVTAGFLETGQDGYIIHDWHEYGGKLIAQRQVNAEKQRRWRERQQPHDTPAQEQSAPTPRNRHVTVTLPSRNEIENSREQNRTEQERENARARATTPPDSLNGQNHNEPLSFSPVASQEMAEAEREAEAEAAKSLISDPKATRDTAHALYDAWCVASGNNASTASERKTWNRILAEMARDVGLGPPGCAPLVERYRAKFGAEKHPTPGQVAAVYSQLEQEASSGTNQHRGPSRQQTPEARASADAARLEAKRAGIAALAAELAAG